MDTEATLNTKETNLQQNISINLTSKVKGKQPEVEEQKIIFKFDCVSKDFDKDYLFMSHYR